ncbi:MAG: T9SS type A sorting domain-containing protein, partial [Flavobacteriales bacterium]
TYQDNINNLETWITQRLTWIDDSLDQYNMVFPTLPNLNDTIICAGDTINYMLPNAYSYDCDPGPKNQVLVPTESGFYTLTATDTLGCFSRQTIHIQARKPNVNFNIQLVDGNHEVNCLALDTTLSYYFWTIGNDTLPGGWTLPYSFDQNGFYNISLSSIDSTGCSWSESQIHWVNTAMVPENGFLVFPNPCKTSFWLVVSNELIGKPFAIIDGFGKLISQGMITNIQQQIDFRLASGLYFIKVDDQLSRLVVE